MRCRHCDAELRRQLIDLGVMPASNDYLAADQVGRPVRSYPLVVWVCEQCWLIQTEDVVAPQDLFTSNYAYFTSTSATMLAHAADFARQISQRLALTEDSLVVEIASNDGYLLRYFQDLGIRSLGIEPTDSTAQAAEELGLTVIREFFDHALGARIAESHGRADLIVANNVYAHVPDINGFTDGVAALLAPGGTVTIEFPHVLNLLRDCHFDTIYHEHYSYLSLIAVETVFRRSGLRVFDVEEIPTHGGSLRIHGCHDGNSRATEARVEALRQREGEEGLTSPELYRSFQARADAICQAFSEFLATQRSLGMRVVGYGAAAKGNTLLNRAGVTTELLPAICDAAPSKQGGFMPGSKIPIVSPELLEQLQPDFVVILPWNIAGEIESVVRELVPKARLVTAVPELRVW